MLIEGRHTFVLIPTVLWDGRRHWMDIGLDYLGKEKYPCLINQGPINTLINAETAF